MTPKFLAKMLTPRFKYAMWQRGLVTKDGKEFLWARRSSNQYSIGEEVWIAKRLPLKGDEYCFEIYKVKLRPSGFGNLPKTWFGNGRYIVEPS